MPSRGIAYLASIAPTLDHKRLADYKQLPAFHLLNRCTSERMPFSWTINPYRGCEFACKYCYARYTHEFMELSDPYEFERQIFAKQWSPVTFREDLRRIDRRESIALGTATDPYQPAERRYQLTRSILEVFATLDGYRLSIATKSDLIARDVDLLTQIAARNQLSVNMTITTVDTDLARKLEPKAPRPDLRLAALRQLTRAGICCGVLCCPIMPLVNDREPQLDQVAAATAAAGASWMAGNVLFLTTLPREVFFDWLQADMPHLVAKYKQAFSNSAYLRGPYEQTIRDRIHRVRERHHLDRRAGVWEDAPPAVPQLALPFGNAESILIS